MNLVYLAFASTMVAAAVSWYNQDESKLVGSWSDKGVRVSVYSEDGSDKWTHRLVIESEGNTIRKWGVWDRGVFRGPAIGAMPNSVSGESELVSVDSPYGVMVCHQLMAHGVAADTVLNREVDFGLGSLLGDETHESSPRARPMTLAAKSTTNPGVTVKSVTQMVW